MPLNPDEFCEPMSKYRNLYNIFCGKKLEEKIDFPIISDEPIIEQHPLDIDGNKRTLPKRKISINNKEFQFRLIALTAIKVTIASYHLMYNNKMATILTYLSSRISIKSIIYFMFLKI